MPYKDPKERIAKRHARREVRRFTARCACGRSLKGRRLDARYCCHECRQEGSNTRRRLATVDKVKTRDRTCGHPECCEPIPPHRPLNAKYCSDTCRAKWKNAWKGKPKGFVERRKISARRSYEKRRAIIEAARILGLI